MKNSLTLGSLFDGIGGFPLAGIQAGIRPVWASEIEPFPIRVTSKRLPETRHLGDIHGLHGGEIDPVDIITFGSPCQNLSVAGKRAGLSGEQSSLFFEAVRIIREMREKTNGAYPRWAVWENVLGALSSCGRRDFREVLESLVRIKDTQADVPMPEKGKWLSAGEILGDDYSLAWRVLDASKGWGVAQRRRRVFVVLDLDGQRAGKVLFESEGLSGYTPPGEAARQGVAGKAPAGAGTPGGAGGAVAFEPGMLKRKGGHCWEELSGTLRADMGDNQAAVAVELHPASCVHEPSYCMTVGSFAQIETEITPTLEARGFKDPPVVGKTPPREYMVRRLTPGECARLQGYPDGWCEGLETPEPTGAEIVWWSAVFETFRKAVGKSRRLRTAAQIAKWLKNPHKDSAEYKAYGNSVAVPCVFFVLAGIKWAGETEGDP